MWESKISHEGLHKFKVVKGSTREEANLKASLQLAAWQKEWSASQLNTEAERTVSAMDTLLQDGVKRSHVVDWTKLEHSLQYPVEQPSSPERCV